MKTKTLQDVVNNFLDSLDLLDEQQIEAVAHLLEVELKEREFLRNPQNFGREGYDN